MAMDSRCHIGEVEYEKTSPCSARMIELLPGEPDQPLKARLAATCLNSLKDNNYLYNAISYTWSSEEPTVSMFLNDKDIKITTQLAELFLEVRTILTENQYVSFWVDQLCIDQDDDDDKAQQIPKMRAIYERANQIFVWVKPSFEDGDYAIDLVNRLVELNHSLGTNRSIEDLPLPEVLGPPNEENLRSWRALEHLMGHRYWNRTWILPEATAGLSNCLVVYTTLKRSMRIRQLFWLGNVLRQLMTRSPPPEYVINQIPSSVVGRVQNFCNLRLDLRDKVFIPLFDLLFITRRTECTVQEDKIFSMLPFAADVGHYQDDKNLKPSYTKGCYRVYSDLIKWYVTRYRNLDFLGSCTASDPYSNQIPGFDLPSWVPNWTHASFMREFPKWHDPRVPHEDRKPLYSACGPFSHSIDIVEPPSTDFIAETMFSCGLRIAIVHKILEDAADGGFWDMEVENSWQEEIDETTEYSLTAEPYLAAFERTISGDISRTYSNGVHSRPGSVHLPDFAPPITQDKSFQHDKLKAVTRARRMFFARSNSVPSDKRAVPSDRAEGGPTRLGAECKSYMMGIGRKDIEVGDEIWALKGGQVLYILRPRGSHYTVQNTADEPEPGWPHCPSLLWLNGKTHPWNAILSFRNFSFKGECYVHGLMDGEALTYASLPPAARPDTLRDMSSEFEELFIGGSLSYSFVISKDELPDPKDLIAYTHKVMAEAERVDGDPSKSKIDFTPQWEIY